jgi:hypothetical protein
MFETREGIDGMGAPKDFQDLPREFGLTAAETAASEPGFFYPADDLQEMILIEQGD